MQARHIALIQRFYDEMWNRFEKSLIPVLLAEDFRFRGSLGQERRGHAEFAEYVDLVRAAFPDFHNTIEEMFGEGDRPFARLTYRATHRGELFGIPATGKKVEYAGAARFRFRGDRIHDAWVLGDIHGLVQQLQQPPNPENSASVEKGEVTPKGLHSEHCDARGAVAVPAGQK